MKDWDMRGIGVFDVNFVTGEQYWSCELRRILGVADEVPAEFHLFLEHIHPDDRRALLAFAMEPFRPHCPRQCTLEHRLLDPNGVVRWVHVEAGRAFRAGSEDDVIRVIGLVIEIQEPKNRPLACNRMVEPLSITAKQHLSLNPPLHNI